MAVTVIALYYAGVVDTLFDLNDQTVGMAPHLLAAAVGCFAPCCLCCGMLMVWHGCGGSFGSSSGLAKHLRCDILPTGDEEKGVVKGREE